MSDSQYERFANVQMPRWYRVTAWVVRVVGFLTFLVSAWQMTQQDASGWSWPIGGVLVGVILLALPSLPKAFIEQRIRIRGLRDGSFKEYLENEQRKNR
jgi:hypothetical protein